VEASAIVFGHTGTRLAQPSTLGAMPMFVIALRPAMVHPKSKWSGLARSISMSCIPV
jgi:hypothetical protein